MASCVEDVLFDMDGCLYPIHNGVEEYCRERIYTFMTDVLGVEDVGLARELWLTAFRRYNQSLRGLTRVPHSRTSNAGFGPAPQRHRRSLLGRHQLPRA